MSRPSRSAACGWSPRQKLEGRFDAAVVLTPHDEIDLEAVVAAADVVLDTRGAVPPADSVVLVPRRHRRAS